MGITKMPMKPIQIISIAIVLLFVALSVCDCVIVHREVTYHSQMAILNPEDIKEPTVYTTSLRYNNQFWMVAIIGAIEVILIMVKCYKLSIVAAVLELLLTVITLTLGYINQQLKTISCSITTEITYEITAIGYCVTCLVIVNLVMTILLQIQKKKLARQERENTIHNISACS